MFPKNAGFICRRCLTPFFYRKENFRDAGYGGKIGCPHCRELVDKPGIVKRFFKFYPRFTSAIEQLTDCGFEFVNYNFEISEYNRFSIKNLKFKCNSCEGHSVFPLSRTDKLIKNPGLFVCKKCRVQAKPLKNIKEFFVSLRWTHRSAFRINKFLWDVVSPLQLNPDEFPILLPSYGKKEAL